MENKQIEESDDSRTESDPGVRRISNNPFLVDDVDMDPDSDDESHAVENDFESDFRGMGPVPSASALTLTDSLFQSEDSALMSASGIEDEHLSSIQTSGTDVHDSSDIEILKEDRGSGDSIEILESSTSSATIKLNDFFDDIQLCDQNTSSADSRCEPSNQSIHCELDAGQLQATDDGAALKLPSTGIAAARIESQNLVDTPASNTSDSSQSDAQPCIDYSKLQESNPSSYSASPYDSPTHAAFGAVQSQSAPSGAESSHIRPDSLSLPKGLHVGDRQREVANEGYSSLSEYSSRSESMDALIEAATSTPLHSQGTVCVNGEMITFVAHGINDLIKKSRESPSLGWKDDVAPRSRSSSSISSTTSGWSASHASRATRSPSSIYTQSPEDIPPIDPKALCDIETNARKVAESLDTLMQNLVVRLHKMSMGTHDCLNIYKEAVDKTCDAVDANIKSMYALMAKCEELSQAVKPVYQIQDQIKEIKRLLDLFELQLSESE